MKTTGKALHWPSALRYPLEVALARLLRVDASIEEQFAFPRGEPGLVPADSVSWQVFKNPLSVFVGGVAAVLLELAEPRVRSGVWEHTRFRDEPLDRLRRTGHAAMMTVYGPRSGVEPLIARVNRIHAHVRGATPDGTPYQATDTELLDWVQATAAFGFLEAYAMYVRPLSATQRDRFHAEGQASARLYGANSAPTTQAALDELFDRMSSRLEASEIIFEFLRIVRHMPALPALLRPVQGVLIKAAVGVLPVAMRHRLQLGAPWSLTPRQHRLVCRAGALADRLVLRTNPAVQACRRLGLPDDHLYTS